MTDTLKRLALGAVAAFVGLVLLVAHHLLWVLIVAAVLLVVGRVAWWAFMPQRRLTRSRVRYLHLRLRLKLHPGRGYATALAISTRFGRIAMFRRSKMIRRDMTARERWANPDAYSAVLGRAHLGRRVRIDMQAQSVILAPPRTGKTGMLADRILHHQGSVIATSSQPDLFTLTSGARQAAGSRVHVWNPQGLGGIANTFRWDFVKGCDDPATAIRRADAMVAAVPSGGSDGSNDWFASKAGGVLRSLSCAAAIAGFDFRAVSRWVLTPNMQEPALILQSAGRTEFAAVLQELSGKAERTAGSILMFVSRAIQFSTVPELLVSVLPNNGDGLDLESVIRNGESVYMLAGAVGNDTPLAGLMSALCVELHAVAMRVAADSPGGRLPMPCLLAFDEITQCASGVPVARFAADGGGRGLSQVIVAHGVAQLRARYGKDETQALLDTCTCKVVFGGTSDTETLNWLEQVAGTVALHEHGHDASARHPVIAAECVRELLDQHALVISQNCPPLIVKAQMAWNDRLYKRLSKSGRAVAALAAAHPPRELAEMVVTVPDVMPELNAVPADWSEE